MLHAILLKASESGSCNALQTMGVSSLSARSPKPGQASDEIGARPRLFFCRIILYLDGHFLQWSHLSDIVWQQHMVSIGAKVRHYRAEAALFLFLANALLVLASAKIPLGLLSPAENAYLWRRAGVLDALLIAYGLLFVALAFASQKFSVRGTLLTECMLNHGREAAVLLRDNLLPALRGYFLSRKNVTWLFLVLGIGVAVRGYFLAQPMRYDEAYTFFNYINGDFTRAFHYPIPNNHVLHTLLAKLSTLIWGSHPESIRFPAFLAGIASIPLLFCLCRTLIGGRSGLFASAAAAVFPYLVLYSTNARGYSIVVSFSLALAVVGAHFLKAPSIPASVVVSALAALGLLTIPSMAFPISGVYLWLFCVQLLNGSDLRRVLREFVLPSTVMTLAFTAILYSPVVFVTNGTDSLFSNEFVQPQPWRVFFTQVYLHFAETLADFSRDVPPMVWAPGLLLAALGLYGAARRRNWPVLLLLPALLAASLALFVAKHAIPFPRTWIFLIPFVFVLADAGWTYCLENLPRLVRRTAIRGLMAGGAFYGAFLISSNAIAKYHDTGNFPEASIVASFLETVMGEHDAVDGIVPVDYTTYFYLWYRHNMGDIRPRRDHPTPQRFYIVQKSNYPVEETTRDEVVKVFELGNAAVYKSAARDALTAARLRVEPIAVPDGQR